MEKWYWIELIGFDNTKNDYGVSDFLMRTQTKVEGVSILFSNSEFVIDHQNTEKETVLLPCHCTYGGYYHGEERDRQNWTNLQLKGLVKELHNNGIKVFFSLFDAFSYRADDGSLVENGYLKEHEELMYLDKNGEIFKFLCPIKRLKDGTYFETVFAEKYKDVVKYYSFDGIQVADGLSCHRLSVQNGDFSDDLVEQFLLDTGIVDNNLSMVGDNKKEYKVRRKYIIEHRYFDWLKWATRRWERFYETFYKTFENENTLLYFNSAWTRDPFEAYLRYGIDYKTAMSKADGIMAEWAIPANINSIEDMGGVDYAENKKPDYLYEYFLMQQSLKAYLPDVKEYTMSAIKDTFEQWNLMDIAPMEQESAFFARNHNFVFNGKGFENASNGPWYCLSSGLTKEQWEKLNYIESVSRIEKIQSPIGFLSVWSDNIESEVKRYLETYDYSRSKLSYELLTAGLCVSGAVRVEDVQKVNAPLFIANSDTFTQKEIAVLNDCRLPMVIIGVNNTIVDTKKIYHGKYISVWVKNIELNESTLSILHKYDKVRKCKKNPYFKFGGIWSWPIEYNVLTKAFFKELANLLNNAFYLPQVFSPKGVCTATAWKISEKQYRMLIINPTHIYTLAKVKLPFNIEKVSVLNKSKNHFVEVHGNYFSEKVCPRGTSIVEIIAK